MASSSSSANGSRRANEGGRTAPSPSSLRRPSSSTKSSRGNAAESVLGGGGRGGGGSGRSGIRSTKRTQSRIRSTATYFSESAGIPSGNKGRGSASSSGSRSDSASGFGITRRDQAGADGAGSASQDKRARRRGNGDVSGGGELVPGEAESSRIGSEAGGVAAQSSMKKARTDAKAARAAAEPGRSTATSSLPLPGSNPVKLQVEKEWHDNIHIAMVSILTGLWNDMRDRRAGGLGEEADAALARLMSNVRRIGQGITAFSLSNLQTHSLISNTVQLCYKMAGDRHCRLAKGYPPPDASSRDVYHASTDDSGGEESDSDSDGHSLESDSRHNGFPYDRQKKPSKSGSRMTKDASESEEPDEQLAARANRGYDDDNDSDSDSDSASDWKESDAECDKSVDARRSGENGVVSDRSEPGSGSRSNRLRRSVQNRSAGGKGSGREGSGGGHANGGGGGGSSAVAAVRGKKKKAKGKGKAKEKEPVVSTVAERVETEPMPVRQRYEAAVVSLHTRSSWASIPQGRFRRDVFAHGHETIMSIFVDSYYRQDLSERRLQMFLGRLEEKIAMADKAATADLTEAPLEGGIHLSDVGLDNIMLTTPK